MIQTIKLKGFQSHKETEFKLHPGLNIIVGASDSGKTAVLRAVRWVIQNEPLGDSFINNEMNAAEVVITTDKGTVVRRKSKSENTYIVNDKVFQGFGTRVPDEVYSVLGMQKAVFGDDSIFLNYAMQLDPPFMLSETSGQAARMLGKLAGTEDLDLAGKLSNSDLIKLRSQKTSEEEKQKSYTDKLLLYKGLDTAAEKLHLLKGFIKAVEDKQKKLELLKVYQSKLQLNKNVMLVLKQLLEKIVLKDTKNLQLFHTQFTNLTDYFQKLQKNNETHKRLTLLYSSINFSCAEVALSNIVVRQTRHNEITVYNVALIKNKELQKAISEMLPHFKFSHAEVALSNLRGLQILWQQLIQIDGQYKFTSVQKKRSETILERLQLKDISKITQLKDYLTEVKKYNTASDFMKQERTSAMNTITKSLNTVQEVGKQFKDYLLGIGVCPVCFSEMSFEKINKHVEDLCN